MQLAAVLLLLKCVLLIVDPHLRIFLGDSASYLHAAVTDWVPPDRSFTYPWLVQATAVATRSAFSLILLQTLFGVASCLIVFWMLRRVAGLDRWVAAVPALLLALEPGQLFYERMLMAEAAGGLALLGLIAAVVAYVHRGRWRWVPVIAVAGIIVVSLRMSLLPVVLGITALAPVLRALVGARSEDRGRPLVAGLRFAAHLGAVLLAVMVVHAEYRQLHARITQGPADYMRAQGQMRLGLIAPLVQPEHLARVGLPASVLDELKIPLRDPRMREAHIWSEGGLWQVLRAHAGSEEEAQTMARKVSARALQSDPLALLRLGFGNFRDYFDPEVTQHRMNDDLGVRPLDEGVIEGLARWLAHDVAAVQESRSLVFVAFESSRVWLTAVLFLLAPLALCLVLLRWRDPHPGMAATALVLGFVGLGLVASQLLFSHIVSFRYLHPMPPILLAVVALLVARGPWRELASPISPRR
jgi:hypothetical protein